MGNLVLNGATSGATTLQPTDATTNTITLPANSGTVVTTASTGAVSQSMISTNVAPTGPIFNAVVGTGQTISAGTFTKVGFDTAESWGGATNGWDAVNKRFKPTVAGYYSFTGYVYCSVGWPDQSLLIVRISGSDDKRLQDSGSKTYNLNCTGMVYLNGTTDYLEIYVYSGPGATLTAGGSLSWIRGTLVRAA